MNLLLYESEVVKKKKYKRKIHTGKYPPRIPKKSEKYGGKRLGGFEYF
jgi:hypothetical protein